MSTAGSLTRSLSSVSVRRISACARQERQHRAGIGAQRARHRVGDLPLDRRARIAAEIARLDREGAALALDHRRVAEQLRHARAVERRRHHQELEVLAQALLRVARQRQAEIGIERALVEFVEQHRGDAVERRIVEDQPREHAFGDDLDAGACATPSSRSARAGPTVSPTLSPSVAAMRSAAARAASRRGSSTRIFLSAAHGSSSQHQRHARGLAGARRRHQHGGVALPQRRGQPRQRLVDRERSVSKAMRMATRYQRACGRDQPLRPRPPDAVVDEAALRHLVGADRCCAGRPSPGLPPSPACSRSRSSARNCSHSVTITSASAPSAQA